MTQATQAPSPTATAPVSDAKTVGIGMVGVGGRGRALLESLLRIPGVAIVSISDTGADSRQRAVKMITAAGQPAPKETTNWSETLADPDVQAIVSALPCDKHAQNYLEVIAAGKDLYGEKPMCLTVAECNAVVDAANNSKQIVQIGFQRRADPRFLQTMARVHSGELAIWWKRALRGQMRGGHYTAGSGIASNRATGCWSRPCITGTC